MTWIRRSVLILIAALALCVAASAAEPPADVGRAARDGLPGLLSAIPDGSLRHFGFAAASEFDRCDLGTGLPLRLIHPDVVLSDARPVFTDLDAWIFPVRCDGETRVLLTVAHHQGRWQAVDLGAAPLAADLQAALARDDAPDPALVRQLQSGAVFLQRDARIDDALIPLGGTGRMLGARVDGPMRIGDILVELRPMVTANLDAFATDEEVER